MEGNFEKNLKLLPAVETGGAAPPACTMAQVALAWLLARGDDIVPIPGTKRRTYLEQNVAATEHRARRGLGRDARRRVPARQAAAGLRYPEFQLKGMGI